MELQRKDGFYFVSLTDTEFILLARPGSLLCRLRAKAPARCDWQWQLGPGDEKFLVLRQDHLDIIANSSEIATLLVEMDLQGLLYDHLFGLTETNNPQLSTSATAVKFPFYQGHLSPESEEYAITLTQWENSEKWNPLDHPVNHLPPTAPPEQGDIPENLTPPVIPEEEREGSGAPEAKNNHEKPFAMPVDLLPVESETNKET